MQQYEKEGKWVYEQHPFWCTGFTYWELFNEAPDLFLHLSCSDLVIFKGARFGPMPIPTEGETTQSAILCSNRRVSKVSLTGPPNDRSPE